MSKYYVIDNIRDYIKRMFQLNVDVTEVNTNQYVFDFGNIGSFQLNTDLFKSEVDLYKFKLGLSYRLNHALNLC